MTIINLKEFFYWYMEDEYIEVADEVAAELRADHSYETNHWRRMKRNGANYSLDAEDGIDNSISQHEPSPQELLERMERFYHLWNALNSLPETQGRRVDAHFILGMGYRAIGRAEGVDWSSVRESVREGLKAMKKYFRENF